MDARRLVARHFKPPYARRAMLVARRAQYELLGNVRQSKLTTRNNVSTEPVTGSSPTIVSLTTFGRRLGTVHLAIESIGAGIERPSRLVLWIQDESEYLNRPDSIRRLESRGLEVRLTRSLRSHTKYFPALPIAQQTGLKLVTADDDVLYPKNWLHDLVEAFTDTPRAIVCHMSHLIRLEQDGTIAPYTSWDRNWSNTPSNRAFSVGASGALLPPVMISALRRAGDRFLSIAPTADDVWLNGIATATQVPTRQVSTIPIHFAGVKTADPGLAEENVRGGGNDAQIRDTYSASSLSFIRAPGSTL